MGDPRDSEVRTIKKASQEENGELKEALCFLEAEGYAYKEFHCMHSPLLLSPRVLSLFGANSTIIF